MACHESTRKNTHKYAYKDYGEVDQNHPERGVCGDGIDQRKLGLLTLEVLAELVALYALDTLVPRNAKQTLIPAFLALSSGLIMPERTILHTLLVSVTNHAAITRDKGTW